jgi:hypothetical protein
MVNVSSTNKWLIFDLAMHELINSWLMLWRAKILGQLSIPSLFADSLFY